MITYYRQKTEMLIFTSNHTRPPKKGKLLENYSEDSKLLNLLIIFAFLLSKQ